MTPLPPLTSLRFLANCLALGEDPSAARDAVRNALGQGHVDWRRVIWLASAHLVTPSLAAGLERMGCCDRLPEDVAGYLDAFRQLNRERNALFREELGHIAARLNRLGLEPLLLKGANALLPDAYPGAEDRMLGDLDLWLPAAHHPEAMAVLLELGYEPAHESRQWWMASEHAGIHHGVPLLHRTLPTKVELHTRLLLEPADDAHLVARLKTVTYTLPNGAHVLTPDRLSQIRQNFLHGQISDHQARERRLNLRYLLEFARLAASLDPGDAANLLAGLRPERHRTFLEYWALAEHWVGLPYPESLPRSPRQNRELWLIERAAESRTWAKSFRAYGQLWQLPPRLLRFGKRVWQKPGYIPFRLKALGQGTKT